MQKYRYVVAVEAETQDQADQVIAERVYYYEDYGFYYRINVEEEV